MRSSLASYRKMYCGLVGFGRTVSVRTVVQEIQAYHVVQRENLMKAMVLFTQPPRSLAFRIFTANSGQ